MKLLTAIVYMMTEFNVKDETKIQKTCIQVFDSELISDEGGPTSPPTMPFICNVDFINKIIHCA